MKYLTILLLGFVLSFCTPASKPLQYIQQQGEIKVAVLPYTNLSVAQKKLDLALIQSFAKQLGVKWRIVTVSNTDEILELLRKQKVQFAITHDPLHKHSDLRITPFYRQLEHYLVYHQKNSLISKNHSQFTEKHPIKISQHIIYEKILEKLKTEQPELKWQAFDASSKNLLSNLNTQHLVLTDSQQLAAIRHFYPQLLIANMVSKQQIGWAFLRDTRDENLYKAAVKFIEQSKYSGELERLKQHYYGELTLADDFNSFNINSFYKNTIRRLPLYRHYFEKVALQHHMDWRLIAAIGYEESLWNPDAVSRTGVRGLMMLTQDTADYLDVEDRENPFQSIEGGARYLKKLYLRLPDKITEPDRSWFMFAAYNVGYGHLIDARILAQQDGFNPNHWSVVKKYLLLLSKRKWYKKTKYGKARGYEAVEYVRRVRLYYAMLRFADQKQMPEKTVYLSNGYKGLPDYNQSFIW